MKKTMPSFHLTFTDEDRRMITGCLEECLSTGQLTLGKYGREFERQFAERVGAAYAVAINSGTGSLEILMRVLGMEGREVLVPTNTFFATPAAVLHAGGRVRFVDLDPRTFSITVDALERRVTAQTAGVIVVHVAGIVTPGMPEIQAWCRERGLFLVEDAAHAHGSTLNGQPAGTFGVAASFSFYPTKVITSGEGGMIITGDERIYQEALVYRDQGKASFHSNFHTRLGYNWRLSEPHAIIGLAQLRHLDEFIAARQRIAAVYDRLLEDPPRIAALSVPDGCVSNYYKYIAVLDSGVDRASLKQTLRERHGLGLSGEVYEIPCHQQPVFRGLDRPAAFPYAEDLCARHVCLPLFPQMKTEDAEYVVESLTDVLRRS